MSSISRCNNNEAVRELTWENGQISLHGLLPPPNNSQTKQTYHGLDHNCTLESIVHQATSFPSSSSAQWREISDMQVDPNFGINDPSAAENMMVKVKTKESMNMNRSKRERNISDHHDNSMQQCGRSNYVGVEESACGSASATFCRDHTDTTMMTWPSLESPRSLKCARLTTDHDHDHDSLYHDCSENHDGEGTTKGESFRSQSSARRSRAAAIHNQSERRRRDRINEKMKTLQKLVPNASKTDKASMLDEVIEYLKQLQAQVQMMSSSARNMPQMMMPMGMQQLQMSMLARMGMGMGMVDGTGLGRNMPHSFPPLLHAPAPTPPFVPQPFPMPPMVPATAPFKPNFDATPSTLPNFNDAYVNTFLAQQSMNMEFLNKMSALYRQQSSQQPSKKPAVSLSLPNDGRGHHGQ